LDSCGIFKDAVLSILATIAKQERIRISERVHAGLAKARKQSRIGGRPRLVLSHAKVLALRQEGCTVREIAPRLRRSYSGLNSHIDTSANTVGVVNNIIKPMPEAQFVARFGF
jgi:DNA invertase Pin-like site-specific DNA recombinase